MADVGPTTTTTNQFGTTTVSSSGSGSGSISQMFGRSWVLSVAKPGSDQPVGTGDTPAAGQSSTAIDVGHDTQSLTQDNTSISLTNFHFTFEVLMQQEMTPWTMTARVYNVPPDYLPGLLEYSEVQLVAGYQRPTQHTNPNVQTTTGARPSGVDTGPTTNTAPSNAPGGSLLFSGQVVFIEHGRENATDTFIELHCASMDDAINSSVSNSSLPAGSQAIDIIGRCTTDMNQYNGSKASITVGQITPTLDTNKSPRGRVLYGPTEAVLRDVGQSANGFFHIDQKGQLHLIAAGEILPNPVITLNSKSGMIDVPFQSLDGSMHATSLLNPDLRPGRLVQLNEKDVTRTQLTTTASAGGIQGVDPGQQQQIQQAQTMGIAADGYYTIWSVRHYGDTRGNPWYSEITTMAVDPEKAQPQAGTKA